MDTFNGMYRGVVVDNKDPLYKGRVKIYVPGVYSESLSKNAELLPWAEPVMPIFGGGWIASEGSLNTETGVTSVPHAGSKALEGAQVWLFFEAGSQNFPRYFGAVQSGPGWLSENTNQHCIQTDNVSIRIDEHPVDEPSTCIADAFDAGCVQQSKIKDAPVRVDVKIKSDGIALNLVIDGNVNMKINGDVIEEHTGNKYVTHTGDLFVQHDGNVEKVHNGDVKLTHTGDNEIIHEGDDTITHTGDSEITHKGDGTITHTGDNELDRTGDTKETLTGKRDATITGDTKLTMASKYTEKVGASKKETVGGMLKVKASVIKEKAGIILHN